VLDELLGMMRWRLARNSSLILGLWVWVDKDEGRTEPEEWVMEFVGLIQRGYLLFWRLWWVDLERLG